jgi:hypothetical protein
MQSWLKECEICKPLLLKSKDKFSQVALWYQANSLTLFNTDMSVIKIKNFMCSADLQIWIYLPYQGVV